MFGTMYLKNPDIQQIYHVWHFCKKCGTVYTHSQASFETIKRSGCCSQNEYLETISTKKDYQPVCVIEGEKGFRLSTVTI